MAVIISLHAHFLLTKQCLCSCGEKTVNGYKMYAWEGRGYCLMGFVGMSDPKGYGFFRCFGLK